MKTKPQSPRKSTFKEKFNKAIAEKHENNQVSKSEVKEEVKRVRGKQMKWKSGRACLIGVPEQEYQNNGIELIFKIMIQENFPEMNHILKLTSEKVHLVTLT